MSDKKADSIYKFKGSLRRSVAQAKRLWQDQLSDALEAPDSGDSNEETNHLLLKDTELGEIICIIEQYKDDSSILDTEETAQPHLYCSVDSDDYWGASLLFKVLSWLKKDCDFTPEHILGWGACTREDNNLFVPRNLSKLERKVVSDGVYHGIYISSDNYIFEKSDLDKFSSYNYVICVNGTNKSHLFACNNLLNKELRKNQLILLHLQPKNEMEARAL